MELLKMVKDFSRNQYLRKRNLPLARLFFSLLLDCVAENLHFQETHSVHCIDPGVVQQFCAIITSGS